MMAYCDSLYLYRIKSVQCIEEICGLINSITNKPYDLENMVHSIIEQVDFFSGKEEYAKSEIDEELFLLFYNQPFWSPDFETYICFITTFGTGLTEKAEKFIKLNLDRPSRLERLAKRKALPRRPFSSFMSVWFGGNVINSEFHSNDNLIDLKLGKNYALFALGGSITLRAQKSVSNRAYFGRFYSTWWNDKMSFRASECLEKYKTSIEKCISNIRNLSKKTIWYYSFIKDFYNARYEFRNVNFSELDEYEQNSICSLANETLELAKLINEEIK